MCLTQVGFRVWCKRKLTLLLNKDSVVENVYIFSSSSSLWNSLVLYSTLWLTCAWGYFHLIEKTCLYIHGNKFLLLLSSHSASIQDLENVFWSYKPLDWVISDIRGWAQLRTSKSPVSCAQRGGGELRYACEETLETTQLQAPDSLSYNGSFGAKRNRKKWCMYCNLLPCQKCAEQTPATK